MFTKTCDSRGYLQKCVLIQYDIHLHT